VAAFPRGAGERSAFQLGREAWERSSFAVFRGASGMGRDPFRRGFDAERQWLHSHAERGNDHQLSSGGAGRGNDQVLLCFVVLQVWGGIRSDAGLTRSVSGCIPTRSGGTISFPAGTRGVGTINVRAGTRGVGTMIS
jgi:hypothetical protein